MTDLITRIQNFSGTVTFESLHDFVKSVDLDADTYSPHIREPEIDGDYGRNILTEEPFECVLIHWPSGIESGIHLHAGLFGHVLVLEGRLDDHRYEMKGGALFEKAVTTYGVGGIMPEPDGVIHKLRNGGSEYAITVHFYYPAITSFEGMKLFNTEKGAIGTLGPVSYTHLRAHETKTRISAGGGGG